MASALCSSSELINLPCWFNSFELSSETSVCFSPKQVVVLYLTSSQNGSQLMKIDALKLFFSFCKTMKALQLFLKCI